MAYTKLDRLIQAYTKAWFLYRKHVPKPVRFTLSAIAFPFNALVALIVGIPLFLITGLICGIMHAWEDYE